MANGCPLSQTPFVISTKVSHSQCVPLQRQAFEIWDCRFFVGSILFLLSFHTVADFLIFVLSQTSYRRSDAASDDGAAERYNDIDLIYGLTPFL